MHDGRLNLLITLRSLHPEGTKFNPDNCSLKSGSADETIKIWNIQTGLHQTFKAERPYEGMNIAGVKGLDEEAIATLIRLGTKSGDR
ncbi:MULTISPECIES: hypothetical protein [unclassified Leptolyngbya]|uniref:hypothetical protein n=1 Tax=unclassified Leptolyngbya TaxID=2650499 RepID=UPI001687DD58|nr:MULTISPECIES: hypothetical protein [unclassified Leptolyngbya]MBD1909321.1 hypothetical protein [Leptolyngbya sp. FACHB-8]MBD2158179.1 hypothetical protein [Leptolyngbya sp. FACHB-16]